MAAPPVQVTRNTIAIIESEKRCAALNSPTEAKIRGSALRAAALVKRDIGCAGPSRPRAPRAETYPASSLGNPPLSGFAAIRIAGSTRRFAGHNVFTAGVLFSA